MTELNDLIRFENENTSLDFKAVQYSKAFHEALIKDIMAMANANSSGYLQSSGRYPEEFYGRSSATLKDLNCAAIAN